MNPVVCILKYKCLILYDKENIEDSNFESLCNSSIVLLFTISEICNDCDKSFLGLLKASRIQRALVVWQKAVLSAKQL
jgi:hypothetical protein